MRTSSSSELLSHPDRTLARHLRGCDEVSSLALQFKFISEAFYSKALLEEMRRLLVFFHDFGKGTDFFQYKIIEAIREESVHKTETADFLHAHQAYIDAFLAAKGVRIGNLLHAQPSLGNHAKLGAYLVQTVFQHDDALLPVILLKVIRRHHGNLTNFATKGETPQITLDATWEIPELEEQLANFSTDLYQQLLANNGLNVVLDNWPAVRDRFTRIREKTKLEAQLQKANDLRYFFLQHYLFSLLLAADKGDMMTELTADKREFIKPNRLLPETLVDDYKAHLFKGKEPGNIDHLREKAYQRVIENAKTYGGHSFFSLTLPTGLGKTFAAYTVAVELQHRVYADTGQTPRIIYCLPFTSVIDQNAQILADMIAYRKAQGNSDVDESWLATHHYLSTHKEQYDERDLQKDEGEYLTAGWEQEIVVTTFVQLLESIFTNRNKALRKFHNLTNAVLILDEVQSIPPKYFEAVEAVFKKLADYFGTKFVFVTATQPFLFRDHNDVIELTDPRPVQRLEDRTQTKYYFDELNRIQLDQQLLVNVNYGPREIADWIDVFRQDITDNPAKSFLIICNTIRQSQDVFTALKNDADAPIADFIYLSSSLLPVIRRQKIDRIKQNITDRKRQIVVSTQVVEAGVDIDLDVVYRDFAPIDSLNQSAGRCNRNGARGQGVVKLFHTGKARFIYDDTLLDLTLKVLRTYPGVIDEKDLYQLNLDYAKAVRQKVAEQADESANLIRHMKLLNLEDVQASFKLIEEDRRSYNVFVPYCEAAKKVWGEYIEACKQADFERKRAIKKVMPALLQYVTRFPRNHYDPPKNKEESFIIYEKEWEQYYDLETGFIRPDDNATIFA